MMLSVAHLVWHPLVPEGYGTRQRILALATLSPRLDVHVVGPGEPPPGLPRFHPVKPFSGPRVPWWNPQIMGFLAPWACARMAREARRRAPHVVVAEGLWTVPAGWLASRGRCPLVVSVNNVESDVLRLSGRTAWARAVAGLEGWWYRLADCVVVVSDRDAARVRALARGSCSRVEVVPNGVFLPPASVSPVSLPRPNVVFVGKTDYPPNAQAIRILEEEWIPYARGQGIDLTCVVVGGPSPPCRRGFMHYTGYVPQVWPYLASSDAFVAPLRAGSGTRIKVLTALAAGLPVIATAVAVDGLPLQPHAHYVPAEDPHQFVEAWRWIWEAPERAEEVRRRGREVARHFSWESVAERWSQVLWSVVAPGPGQRLDTPGGDGKVGQEAHAGGDLRRG